MGDQNIAIIRKELRRQIGNDLLPPYVYTYPPKGSYRSFGDPHAVLNSWRKVTGPLNLYIHIPFCSMKCSFCDLFSTVEKDTGRIDSYVDTILAESDLIEPYLRRDALELNSIYFGGGTPGLLKQDQLARILDHVKRKFAFHPNLDVSIEGTPDSFDAGKLTALKESGFTRVSIGVESFDGGELAGMGRGYDPACGQRAIEKALELNFQNINVDLIYGFPGQTFSSWRKNLNTAAAYGINTITAYPFVRRNRTGYGRQLKNAHNTREISHKKIYEWYDHTLSVLQRSDFEQLTLVTFARSGGGCAHEAGEFEGIPTLALGAGARSYNPDVHYTDDDYTDRKPNRSTVENYIKTIAAGAVPVKSAIWLSDEEKKRRYVILSLLSSGTSAGAYRRFFKEPLCGEFGDFMLALELEGLAVNENEKIRLTKKGRRYSSTIAAYLASEAVKEVRGKYS